MARVWRWRRCPACGAVAPAGSYEVVGRYRAGWTDWAAIERRCPNEACRYEAPSWRFRVVRERHPIPQAARR